jgi:hypothetical protein
MSDDAVAAMLLLKLRCHVGLLLLSCCCAAAPAESRAMMTQRNSNLLLMNSSTNNFGLQAVSDTSGSSGPRTYRRSPFDTSVLASEGQHVIIQW